MSLQDQDRGAAASVRPDTVLTGLRVLELSQSAAGAYCGLILARLGASVSRCGPLLDIAAEPHVLADALAFFDQGKTAVGDDEARLLLRSANIVIVEAEGRSAAAQQRFSAIVEAGVPDDAVQIRISPNGDGSAGCALTSSAWSGMSWAIGRPEREPLTLPYDLPDMLTGANAAAAALLGVLTGAQASSARRLEVAGRDVMSFLVGMLAPNYLPFGRPWRREGTRPSGSGGVYPCGLFPCRDGYVAIYCRSEKEWHGLLAAMGDPDWARPRHIRDPRLVARDHADEVDAKLMPWLADFSRDEVMALGQEHGFPVGAVKFMDEAIGDDQFVFRNSLRPSGSAAGGPRLPSEPWRLYAAPRPGDTKAAREFRPAAGNAPAGLLAGLRVIDFSWVWSGPLVTSILADLGADVLKIEHPSRLDSLRQRGRPLRNGIEIEGPQAEVNPWFNQLNHAKKSVVLDIKSESDRRLALELARSADVVVENMRPGALGRLGLGYEQMCEANPRIVMLSMSMAGQFGPLSNMRGYAGIMTAMAGAEALVGYPGEDGPDDVTGMTMTALGDPNGAFHGIVALLAGLYRRRATGKGLWIDLSQTEAILSVLPVPVLLAQSGGGRFPVPGNTHPLHAPHGHFPTRDGAWIAVAVRDDDEWRRLVASTAGHLDGFHSLDGHARVAMRDAIGDAFGAWTAAHDLAALLSLLGEARVAAAPVQSYEDMHASGWVADRRLTMDIDHPHLGVQRVYAVPWQIGGLRPGIARPAPSLGEHTRAILGALPVEPLEKAGALPSAKFGRA